MAITVIINWIKSVNLKKIFQLVWYSESVKPH